MMPLFNQKQKAVETTKQTITPYDEFMRRTPVA
jgi:hypothetical protein